MTARTAQLDAKELELGRISRDHASYLQVRDTSLQGLRASLPPRSALLELRLYRPVDFKVQSGGEPHWAGVLIGADGTIIVRDLGAVANTARLVGAVLANAADTAATAGTLYRQFLLPFDEAITGLQRLYVAPDGVLHLLPFGLLRDADGRRVMEGHDLRVVQSGRDLLRPVPDKPASGLVAVGGIDFGETKPLQKDAAVRSPAPDDPRLPQMRAITAETFRDGFTTLLASREEVETIGELYRGIRRSEKVAVIEGGQPTKAWLLELPPPRVLHLATHGFYRERKQPTDRPMLLAGVALAGANRSLLERNESGILYALEAQDLNLEGTELVVLSACETARGQIDYGDGVSGLVRALRTAGARNVMVTLRSVNDQAAAAFMQRFYFYWLKQPRSDPAAALRDAQREQAADPKADPTWTSFMLVGG